MNNLEQLKRKIWCFDNPIHIGPTDESPSISSGIGDPNGRFADPKGSLYLQTEAGTDIMWVKSSAAGILTGWIQFQNSTYISTVDTDKNGSNNTSPQSFLPVGRTTFAAQANTLYEFLLQLYVTNGTTTCTKAFGIAGTAIIDSIRYVADGQHISVGSQGATQNSGHYDSATSTVVLATGTSSWWLRARGLIRVTMEGSLIPQIAFSADPTGTILFKKNSFFSLRPLGPNTFASFGAWS